MNIRTVVHEDRDIARKISTAPLWRRRSFVVAALVAMLAIGVGATIAALVPSDSSATDRSVERVASPVGPAGQCLVSEGPIDAEYLLALIASLPEDTGARIAASLSPQTQQLVGGAAAAAAFGSANTVSAPDAPTLAGVLSRLSLADRTAVLNELPPDISAEVAPLTEVALIPACSP
jgi:hypothetical protein